MEPGFTYNLRGGNKTQLQQGRTTSFGVETLAYLRNKLWQFLPHSIEQSNTLSIFKKPIRIGTVIDASVGSVDRISQEWGF